MYTPQHYGYQLQQQQSMSVLTEPYQMAFLIPPKALSTLQVIFY